MGHCLDPDESRVQLRWHFLGLNQPPIFYSDTQSRRVLLLSSNPEFYLHTSCWMPTAALDWELSNQCRSKKIGDGATTKKTELDVLQRQRNKGAKDWESGGRGIVPGALLKRPRRKITAVCSTTLKQTSSKVYNWKYFIPHWESKLSLNFVYSVTTCKLFCKFGANYFYITGVYDFLYSAVRLMEYVQSDVMCLIL